MNAATNTNLPNAFASVVILGEDLVSQLVSGFSSAVDSAEKALISQIDDKINAACETQLGEAICSFFKQDDAIEMALAFDVNAEHLNALQTGSDLKTSVMESTRKVLMLSAITATMSIDAIENMVVDYLVDLSK